MTVGGDFVSRTFLAAGFTMIERRLRLRTLVVPPTAVADATAKET